MLSCLLAAVCGTVTIGDSHFPSTFYSLVPGFSVTASVVIVDGLLDLEDMDAATLNGKAVLFSERVLTWNEDHCKHALEKNLSALIRAKDTTPPFLMNSEGNSSLPPHFLLSHRTTPWTAEEHKFIQHCRRHCGMRALRRAGSE